MATGLDLIRRSLLKAGVLTKTETPDADESADALNTINEMLASWSNDSLMISGKVRESFALTAGTSTYTIGSGQDFDTARPIKLLSAFVRQDTFDYPLDIYSDEAYENLTNKDYQGIPELINYDGGYPTGKLRLYYAPTSGLDLHIMSEKEITSIALNTDVDFAPGWNRAIIYNAAIELAPEFGQPVTQEIAKIARESLAAIKNAAARNQTLQFNQIDNGAYNVLRGY